MKMQRHLRITNTPLVPIILSVGAILVLCGQAGFGQQYIALPMLLGLATGRLFRVDDNSEV